MWFTDVAFVENPGKKELLLFVQDVRHFLLFILEDRQNFGFLWQHDSSLHTLAMDTMKQDISQGGGLELDEAIHQLDDDRLISLGLHGQPLTFKFRVLNTVASEWKSAHRDFSVRAWLIQVIAAIDTILDPLIEAASGAGRVIKDFKDAISCLAWSGH